VHPPPLPGIQQGIPKDVIIYPNQSKPSIQSHSPEVLAQIESERQAANHIGSSQITKYIVFERACALPGHAHFFTHSKNLLLTEANLIGSSFDYLSEVQPCGAPCAVRHAV
jgi:hypothetical protein